MYTNYHGTSQYTSYFSAYSVIVLIDDGLCPLFAPHRVFVDVGRQVFVIADADAVVFAHCCHRPQKVCVLHELSGELGSPPDIVVAPSPLERAVRVFRVSAAPAARQHSGRAIPGHGVCKRGRAECVRERLFSRAYSRICNAIMNPV